MQVAGEALVISRDDLSAHLRAPGNLAALLTHYAGLLVTFVAQSAACTQFHVLEQRAARWLLIMHDRTQGDELTITHQYLAYMLGAQRPGVTLALEALRSQGLITLARGTITISNRTALEAAVCECYRRVEQDYQEPVRVASDVSIGKGHTYAPGEQVEPRIPD